MVVGQGNLFVIGRPSTADGPAVFVADNTARAPAQGKPGVLGTTAQRDYGQTNY